MGLPQPPSTPLDTKLTFDEHEEAIVGSYCVWLEKHPSALEYFEQIASTANGKKMIIFLDYDGTLSPIVNNPDQAFMSDAMRSAVREVANCFPTTIVSGRSRDKVFEFVKLNNLYYAGSHGMDISTPSGSLKYENHKHQSRAINEKGDEVVNFCPAQEFLPKIKEIKKVLQEMITNIKGAMVEDNKFCISVHFRCVNEKDVGTLKNMVESVMESYENFRISEGKKVMEIRPTINWDKGHALQYLLETHKFDNSSDVLPIYMGDDKTDEDAFEMIKQIGRGFAIVVSSTSKETKASYSLRDPTEVMSFLLRLAMWKRAFTG